MKELIRSSIMILCAVVLMIGVVACKKKENYDYVPQTIEVESTTPVPVKIEPNVLFLQDYTGYLDEYMEFMLRDAYVNIDIDKDKKMDRVYRVHVGEDNNTYQVHFADGSMLEVNHIHDVVAPSFILLPNEEGKTLIAYSGEYIGQNGECIIKDLRFLEKQGNGYVECEVPFGADPYERNGFLQYVTVGVELVDKEQRILEYTCEEFPDFKAQVQMEQEAFELNGIEYMINPETKKMESSVCMVYEVEISPKDQNMILCRAHVIYHCDDEIGFFMKYEEGKWQVVEIDMVNRGTGKSVSLK